MPYKHQHNSWIFMTRLWDNFLIFVDPQNSSHVQNCIQSWQVTFDSYLYKTVQGNDPVGDLKLGWKTLSSLYKYNNQKTPDPMRTLAWAWPEPVWHDISQIESDRISLQFGADHVGILRIRGWVAARYQLGIIVPGLIKDWQTCRLELSPRRNVVRGWLPTWWHGESTFSFLMDRRECTWNLNAMPAKRLSLWWCSGRNATMQMAIDSYW